MIQDDIIYQKTPRKVYWEYSSERKNMTNSIPKQDFWISFMSWLPYSYYSIKAKWDDAYWLRGLSLSRAICYFRWSSITLLFAVGRIAFLLPEVAFYLSAMKNCHHANWFGETSATWKLYIKWRQGTLKKGVSNSENLIAVKHLEWKKRFQSRHGHEVTSSCPKMTLWCLYPQHCSVYAGY